MKLDDKAKADLMPLKAKVAETIAMARSFAAPAGSPEMRSAQMALEHLGHAYSMLDVSDPNPAWTFA